MYFYLKPNCLLLLRMLSYTYYGNVNSIENPITKTNITAYFVGNSLLIKNPENQKGEYQLFDLQGKNSENRHIKWFKYGDKKCKYSY